MDIERYADRFLKLAQSLSATNLTPQQQLYRNHVIRIDQQSNALLNELQRIVHPEIQRARHPEWKARNTVMPTTGPVALTGQPLMRPEAISHARNLRNEAVQFARIVLAPKQTSIVSMLPLFNRIAGEFETLRTNYMTPVALKVPGLYLPMRQIRDSLAWMSQYQQKALQEAGTKAVATI